MANPASFTVNDLNVNSSLTLPSVQVVDTDGTVYTGTAPGKFDRVLFAIENKAATACTVAIKAGDQPPAFRQGVGDYSVSMAATGSAGAKRMFGPFESARFMQDDGTIGLSFAKASGSTNVEVICYRLPPI
jgi:hypothetical protein